MEKVGGFLINKIGQTPVQKALIRAIRPAKISATDQWAPIDFERAHKEEAEAAIAAIGKSYEKWDNEIERQFKLLEDKRAEAENDTESYDRLERKLQEWSDRSANTISADSNEYMRRSQRLTVKVEALTSARNGLHLALRDLNAKSYTLCPNGYDFGECTHQDRKQIYSSDMQLLQARVQQQEGSVKALEKEVTDSERLLDQFYTLIQEQKNTYLTALRAENARIARGRQELMSKCKDLEEQEAVLNQMREISHNLEVQLRDRPMFVQELLRQWWIEERQIK